MKAPQKYEEMKKRKMLENQIQDELYYKPGDSISLGKDDVRVYMNGMLTSGRTKVFATLSLSKRLDKINSIVIKNLEVVFRNYQGYFFHDQNDSIYTLAQLTNSSATKVEGSNNMITLLLRTSKLIFNRYNKTNYC